MFTKRFIWIALLTALLVPVLAWSQATSGDLVGTVLDKSGAAVPNASITVVNHDTGVKSTAVTTNIGSYRVSNLLVGTYSITASAPGFAPKTMKGIVVELNKTSTVNVSIEPGQVATTVEVQAAAAPPIDTTTAQLSTTYDAQQAEIGIASTGSGVLNLALLQPGVTTSGGIGQGSGPSVSGQRPTNNSFTIEGIDANDQSVTGQVVTVPNDAVAEFSVLANQFSPEFGHSSGGQFNTVVKSGTNQFHGSLYEYFQNRKLNANDTNNAPAPKPRYDNNRFGGSVGGPIIKNKLFFFGLVEKNPVGQEGTTNSSLCAPTAAGFATLDALKAAGSINATNYAIFKQYVPVATGACANGTSTVVAGQDVALGGMNVLKPAWANYLSTVGSIDYNISEKDQLRGRWIYNKTDLIDTAAVLPEFFGTEPVRAHTVAITEFHTFSSRLTNELRLGFNRYGFDLPAPNLTFPGLDMFPNLTFNGSLGGLGIGPNSVAPQNGFQNTYQLADNVTWTKGAHTVKVGFDGRRLISPQVFIQRSRGDYQWTDSASQSDLDLYLADMSPNDFSERSLANGGSTWYGNLWAFGFFGNDSWKVNQHLTVNLGLRYEYATSPKSESLQALNSAASVPGLIDFSAPKPQKNEWMPRIGFAYSPGTDGKTSIRGGFGISYDVLYTNLGLLALPPEAQVTIDGEGVTPNFLANGGIKADANTFNFGTAADMRAAGAGYLPAKTQNPYSVNWNFGVQHVFANVWTADVRYVGTHGVHLPVQSRLNRQSKTAAVGSLPVFTTLPSQATIDALSLNLKTIEDASSYVPAYETAGFDNGNIVGFMPYGGSIYHGLQTSLDRRFTKGFQMLVSYTWSHAQDNSTASAYSTDLTPRRPQDFQDWNADWATSALDRRQRLTVSAIYETQFKSHGKLMKNLLDGWNFQPQYVFESPEYATVRNGSDINLNGDSAGDRAYINYAGKAGTYTTSTAVCRTGGPATCGDDPAYVVGYVADDPTARYIKQGLGGASNAPRNTMPLPRTNNWNISMGKKFFVTERMNFEFQAQAFNIFNHPQWTPGYIFDVQPTAVNPGDAVALVTTNANNGSFNKPQNFFSSNPRSMQLVLKFNF